MSAAMENPIILDLTPTYGAMIVGTYLSCAIWGISSLQTYLYFWCYDDDAIYLKLLVGFLWCMDTIHQIFVCKATWKTLIQTFGGIVNLGALPQETLHNLWSAYVVVGIVQLYYFRRIVNFASRTSYGRRWWIWPLYAFMTAVFLAQYASLFGFLSETFNRPVAALSEPLAMDFATTLLSCTAGIDIFIGAGMFALLHAQRTQFRATSTMLGRLSFIVVNTGLVTALLAITTLVLDVTYDSSTNLWYTVGQIPACSLYFSGLLANLNSRQYVRGHGGIRTISNFEDLTPPVLDSGISHTFTYGGSSKHTRVNRLPTSTFGIVSNGAVVVDVHKHQATDHDEFSDNKSVDVEMGRMDTKSADVEVGRAH
ncbi:hypothetical protein PENSPDRAFT_81200 [Peniophora sp. CONT]|nr:hypothetical protein PENSPDRAFT_81200 [Peniophora sp. CONT]